MHVLEELARDRKMLCPETGAPVELREGRVLSTSGRDLGAVSGPLNFLDARDTLEAGQVPAAEVEKVRAHLVLPASDDVHGEIAKAIAATGDRFSDSHLSAEARILAERFRIPAFELGRVTAPPASAVGRAVSALGRALTRAPRAERRLEHLANSIGEQLTAGQEVYRSVRVRNAGADTLLAGTGDAARVETAWSSPDGAALPALSIDNELPVDVEPGREITLILRLRAPESPGRHRLLLRVAAPDATPFLTLPIDVVPCDLPVFDYAYHTELLQYEPDHHLAAREVLEYLALRPGGAATLLEIGGGVHPTGHILAAQGHRLVSSDISHSQSILGALYFRHAMPALAESLAFISCDGTGLPFADEVFDGIVLFAAFHHFADPPALLREMKRAIRPDGFIFIGCDNCVPNPRDPEYREELARGINEQMWTLPEYTRFFQDAGLAVARARVDYHSLKVVLVKGCLP